jgi:hypothetical protein
MNKRERELIRLAMIYAEQDRRSFLQTIENYRTSSRLEDRILFRKTERLLKRFRDFRAKHFGLNTIQDQLDNVLDVPLKGK